MSLHFSVISNNLFKGCRKLCGNSIYTLCKVQIPKRQTSFQLCIYTSAYYNSSQTSNRPRLSPQEVSQTLRQNEFFFSLREAFHQDIEGEASNSPAQHAISSVDSNQLAANSPIEDSIAMAKCKLTTGFLVGVFDGHGGQECSQVVSRRLFDYIAASLLPRKQLERVVAEAESGKQISLTESYNDQSQFVPELGKIYENSLYRWCCILLNKVREDFSMEDALIKSFLQLDDDLGLEVLENLKSDSLDSLLHVALTGSVACVAHIDGPHLHVANAGDCGAVLGIKAEDSHGGWLMQRLSADHNWENSAEVKRVQSEHPPNEVNTVVQNQRLLGTLMPFRAFGDFRFKWNRKIQANMASFIDNREMVIPDCLTPPYLTAHPEITYHRLQPHDKFLVLASDGLWESIATLDVVTLVGEYMSGRSTLQPVRLPKRNVTLNEIEEILDHRSKGIKLKPTDTNAATHLIRHSLGYTDMGLDHLRLSHSLTLPPEVKRYFRDDISIHIVFFDSGFLRICPTELQ